MEYITLKGIISVQKTLSGELSQDVLVLVGKSIAEEVIEARDGNECLLDKLNTFVEKIEGKQLSTNDYTNADKSKVDNLPLNTNSELNKKADNDKVYTKSEVDSKLLNKADKSDSLGGYGISDAYTKTETDTAINNKLTNVYKYCGSVNNFDFLNEDDIAYNPASVYGNVYNYVGDKKSFIQPIGSHDSTYLIHLYEATNTYFVVSLDESMLFKNKSSVFVMDVDDNVVIGDITYITVDSEMRAKITYTGADLSSYSGLNVGMTSTVTLDYGDNVAIITVANRPFMDKLASTVDLSNYYTKSETENIAIDTVMNNISGKADITEVWTRSESYSKEELNPILSGKQDVLTFDIIPTTGSTNPVTSGAVKEALDVKADRADTYTNNEIDDKIAKKQDILTFDETPTAGSDNPVKSDGIREELDKKADKSDVYAKSESDDKLSQKQDKLTFDDTPTQGSSNPVTSAAVYNAVADIMSSVYTQIQMDDFLVKKVDKIDGKGLSTNDFTTEEKDKLSTLKVKPDIDNTASSYPPGTVGITVAANTIYNLGKQTSVTITLPALADYGDFIQVDFISGSTASTLTIQSAAGLSDYDLTPEANTIYSLYFDWGILDSTSVDGSMETTLTYGWRFGYSEYTKMVGE